MRTKIPPPFEPTMYGNFQILPRPIAQPALSKINPNLLPSCSLSISLEGYYRYKWVFPTSSQEMVESSANEGSDDLTGVFPVSASSVEHHLVDGETSVDEEEEDPEDRYWLWRFMIDQNEQGKGYGQAALAEIIQYFRAHGADRIFLSTEPENECGVHIYHKAGFVETGDMDDGEAVMKLMLS